MNRKVVSKGSSRERIRACKDGELTKAAPTSSVSGKTGSPLYVNPSSTAIKRISRDHAGAPSDFAMKEV